MSGNVAGNFGPHLDLGGGTVMHPVSPFWWISLDIWNWKVDIKMLILSNIHVRHFRVIRLNVIVTLTGFHCSCQKRTHYCHYPQSVLDPFCVENINLVTVIRGWFVVILMKEFRYSAKKWPQNVYLTNWTYFNQCVQELFCLLLDFLHILSLCTHKFSFWYDNAR